MEDKILRIGWIGCGKHAREMLLPQLLRYPVVLSALCNRGEENLHRIAGKYGVKDLYRNYRDMLDSRRIDVVCLSVGPEAHAEMAVEALARGYPVFMEKPPGAGIKDTEKILAISSQTGKPVGIGFHKRFSAGNRIAKNLLTRMGDNKIAGIVCEYMTSPEYFADDPSYNSFFLHHCVHYCDLVSFFAGPVKLVDVKSHELSAGKILFHVAIRFESGAIGSLVMGTIQSRGNPVERMQIMGDHWRIEVENVHKVRYYRDPVLKGEHPDAVLDNTSDSLVWEPNFTAAEPEDIKGYHLMFGDFFALLDGKPSRIARAEDGAAAMRVLDAISRSWHTRRPIIL